MPRETDKPTAEFITSLRQHLMEVWQPTWGDWEERDTYYFQTFPLWPASIKRPVYHPGRSRQIVDAAVDHQLAFEPIPHRFPAGQGEEHQIRADRVEPYLKAVFDEAALLEPVLTWKAVGKNLIHLGYAVVEGPLLDMAQRPEKPKDPQEDALVLWENAKKTWMPFRIRVPHPSRVLLDPEQKNPRFAIKHAMRYAQDLYEITSKRKGRRRDVKVWEVGENPFALVMCDEYWTPYWHALVANTGPGTGGGSSGGGLQQAEDVLFIEKNSWGYVPFRHAFSGWGQIPSGENQNDPRYLAAGILTPILESLKLQAQAVSGRHNALIEATFNTLGTNLSAEELAAQRARGDILEIPDKSNVWWMEIPQLPSYMFETERWYDQDIEMATMSRSLSGIRQQGVSTVGQEAILSTAAGQKFVAINKQLEHLATGVAGNILRLVDVLGEKLYCRGHTISPDDIESDYSVQVTFELIDPVLQLQRQEIGMREVQAGLKSKETYWSADAKLEDASGERMRILQDYVRQHPAVQEYLAMLVAREMGLGDVLARQQAAVKAGSNGQQPDVPPLYGPDGLPMLGGSLGQAPVEGAGEIRQPLTPNTAKPGRVNPAAFG